MPASGRTPEDGALVDTSVALALVVSDHEAHEQTWDVLGDARLGLAGHAWFETYSVLTRLPPPSRRSPADVARIIETGFPETRFLDARQARRLTADLARAGIAGGAVYDALVGAAARAHGLVLFTRDRRAIAVYRALDVDAELLP